ncbi:deazaflavin-dependent oxidoreductase (nitroreductase family) [Glaciihabitans tibetensis]|uniref:Deazaflavin-dependent oxidoreductase (Nitroreductase family) n=1 Tax=Glaciihabitans tibetensis TaxID=1266600 RepID=A0A2T0VIY9_9MICO|nr:nitroreductase family deazaflavin-dependent oxidoreductase [Glaciihabitans tibetensis]PRY70055.1 deazaflavin-dependent oxidoreductase (nitroreductase family) [Glaciihabitans tibetensis]
MTSTPTPALAPAPIVDNPEPWVSRQIIQYVETDGAKPVFRGGAPLLLLTTRGRSSGQWRRTCLIYGPDAGRFIVVASLGGAPKHPVWYLNLRAHDRVWVQVGAETFWVVARDATAEEKPALWDKMVAIYSDYANYQKKTDREIPVVILEREQ